MEYPKICPAVIVGVTHGDKILMTKYADRANSKNYALIAGFAEIGESIEETVKREVMEEVGLKVKNLRYYTSQPWSFSETLLLGFWCELEGSDEIHLDTEELSVGEWLHRSEIPEASGRISLTGTMIEAFRAGREYEPYQAPDEKEGEDTYE
jgi:NAD+ diphosphatase